MEVFLLNRREEIDLLLKFGRKFTKNRRSPGATGRWGHQRQEQELLDVVNRTRTPYINSYKQPEQSWKKTTEQARATIVGVTLPKLIAYPTLGTRCRFPR